MNSETLDDTIERIESLVDFYDIIDPPPEIPMSPQEIKKWLEEEMALEAHDGNIRRYDVYKEIYTYIKELEKEKNDKN